MPVHTPSGWLLRRGRGAVGLGARQPIGFVRRDLAFGLQPFELIDHEIEPGCGTVVHFGELPINLNEIELPIGILGVARNEYLAYREALPIKVSQGLGGFALRQKGVADFAVAQR